MRSIGFVDYYIDEWHANNYPAWIKNAAEKLGLDFEFKYVWAETASPNTGVTTQEWCEKMGAVRCRSIDELCEKSDAIFILSPTDPDKHLGYAEKVFAYGKPTYVDKTFAECLESAKKIEEAAKKYNTPFFSTSALRYAEELAEFESPKSLFFTGGGRSLEEYVIHCIEMAVILKDAPIECVKVERAGKMKIIHAKTKLGMEIVIVYSPAFGFTVSVEYEDKKGKFKKIESSFFDVLIEQILAFFDTGKAPFSFDETIEAMRFRDLVLEADGSPDKWIWAKE